MAKVYDTWFGLYAQPFKYPNTKFPLYDHGLTREIDPPYRLGISRVFRIPGTSAGFVIGKWVATLPETEALVEAIQARSLTSGTPIEDQLEDV